MGKIDTVTSIVYITNFGQGFFIKDFLSSHGTEEAPTGMVEWSSQFLRDDPMENKSLHQ